MRQYVDLGKRILSAGNMRGDRTGTGTISIFGPSMEFDLQEGFPLLTTKKVFTRGIIHELLWFLEGKTNNNYLLAKNVHIWDDWAVDDKKELTVSERYEIFSQKEGNKLDDDFLLKTTEEMHDIFDQATIPRFKPLEKDGELGPIYGRQWRYWEHTTLALKEEVNSMLSKGYVIKDSVANEDYVVMTKKFDQISELIENLKKKPFSRRHVISAWNVPDLPDESISPQKNVLNGKMALAPCHCLFQFYVREMDTSKRWRWIKDTNFLKTVPLPECCKHTYEEPHDGETLEQVIRWMNENNVPRYYLDCRLDQRSADYVVGAPFNIASYALLTMMIAQCANMVPGKFIHQFGDCHVYKNHIDDFTKQLERELRPLPKMIINPEVKDIFGFKFEDFKLEGYDPHPAIPYPISV